MDPEQPVLGIGDGLTSAKLPEPAVEARGDVAGADAPFPLLSGLWSEQAYHGLRRIQASIDRDNIARANHPIPPAN